MTSLVPYANSATFIALGVALLWSMLCPGRNGDILMSLGMFCATIWMFVGAIYVVSS